MPVTANIPVLVGPVQLLYVQSMSINEGYEVTRIAGSKFVQALSPATKTISIEAILISPDHLQQKKELEVLAQVSAALASATAGALGTSTNFTGIAVVSGLTISTNMQITDLRFTQSIQKRDALDVSVTLKQMRLPTALGVIGEIADLAVAAGAVVIPSAPTPAFTPRSPGAPI